MQPFEMPRGQRRPGCGLELLEQLDPLDGGRCSWERRSPGKRNLTQDRAERVVIAILGWDGRIAAPAVIGKTGTDNEVRILEEACRRSLGNGTGQSLERQKIDHRGGQQATGPTILQELPQALHQLFWHPFAILWEQSPSLMPVDDQFPRASSRDGRIPRSESAPKDGEACDRHGAASHLRNSMPLSLTSGADQEPQPNPDAMEDRRGQDEAEAIR